MCQESTLLFFFFLAAPCSLWDLSSRPGMEPVPPAVEEWSPNHWTTREVPGVYSFLLLVILCYINTSWFIYWTVDGHLDCCQFLSIIDKAAINILEHLIVDIGTHLSWVYIYTQEWNCQVMG